MLRALFFYVVFLLYYSTSTVEYLYPVTQMSDGRICVIYQKNPAHVELWLWDAQTEQANSGLFTRYTPGGLHVLPNGKDFSFIDHGLIKIKYENRDIPHILELNKPLTHIAILHWIDNYKCYTHAKQGDYFGIFIISTDGKVETIIHKEGQDFLYPQKAGPHFFYIEKYKNTRCFKFHYRVMKLNKDEEIILDFGKHALAFLTMVSDTEGFVIEHPQSIKEKKKAIPFLYHYLFKENEQWQKKELFKFIIPSQLLLGSDRLYESLLPLLPRKIGDIIYFVTQTEAGYLAVFAYNLINNSCVQVTETLAQHFSVPIQTNYGMYCGGQVQSAAPGEVAMDLIEGKCCIRLKRI